MPFSILVAILSISLLKNAYASTVITSPWTMGDKNSNLSDSIGTTIEHWTVLTNAGTGTSCPSSSYTSTEELIGDTNGVQIERPESTGSIACERGIMEFDTSQIPTDAVVSKVELLFYEDGAQTRDNCDLTSISTEPTTLSASAKWSAIGSGSTYVSANNYCNTTGLKDITLGSTANSDLQNQLNIHTGRFNSWFAVGFKMHNEVRNATRLVSTACSSNLSTCNGSSTDNHPALKVTFTTKHTSVLISTATINGIQIVTNSATGSACPSASYTKATSATTTIAQKNPSASSASCIRSLVEYNTTGVNISTNNVYKLVIQNQEISSNAVRAICDITAEVTHQPSSSATGTTLWNDVGSANIYIRGDTQCKNRVTSERFDYDFYNITQAITDFKNQISSHWFAIGMKLTNETRDTTSPNTGMLSDNTKKPRLIVESDIGLTVGDTVHFVDNAPTKTDVLGNAFNDGIHFADNTVTKLILKTFTDAFTTTDNAITKSISKSFGDTVTFTDAFSKGILKTFDEAINFVDQAYISITHGGGGAPLLLLLGVFLIPAILLLKVIRRRRRDD